ncbi:hypothetical protein HPB48_003070 [Haemaphysalis longicornis]|uniref:Uncharacterized protein n=1 Tax=Haemaphysalis longicornis TaxID=44386 RepID=A0A9J6FUA9_HAELO|nr:hypothetical protein HPB48_003070 [Haemaphysalis longicornis]
MEERLRSCPCLHRSPFMLRSFLQERFYRCQKAYPTRLHSKPLWKWFWETETRAVAFLFASNMIFSAGDMGVLTMAWMYALSEFPSPSWLPAAAPASTPFVFSMLWVAFGCVRYHVLRKPLENWRSGNTKGEILADDDGAGQAKPLSDAQLCLLVGEQGEIEERLRSTTCLHRSPFVHFYCLQKRIYRCQKVYPVRLHSKTLWKWLWEKETGAVAFLFAPNMICSVGYMGVLAMAWMYALSEFPSLSWLPAAAPASALFVFAMLWVAFGCVPIHVLHKPLENWRSVNTAREVVLDDDGAEEA